LVNFFSPTKNLKEGEKIFTINLNEDRSNYFQSNTINGRLITPLALCLHYAWEILKTNNFEQEIDVVFEEVKVFKATIDVPDDNVVNLTVIVPKGTQKFEIMAAKTLLVTGKIRITNAPNEERVKLCNSYINEAKSFVLNHEDFYLEMEMRGYNYSDASKNVCKSSVDGSRALIKWNNNWVTFMDTAFQLFVFGSDLRDILLPILIRKIVIDLKLHKLSTETLQGKIF
ncbi:fatty acid synthase-like, partial [Copidosoma floridanum]|uniref:fatty acid synthase-like n=1 Tax=Copidosoma floridanum TaxID=29053 RepID=UPI0006C95D17